MVHKGVDDTASKELKKWATAYEIYALEKAGAGTVLEVTKETMPRYGPWTAFG